ncbi:MAG TPA: hypothetical protein PKI01_03965 [Bacteroidales bacterium]|nr:hypothetical protein [Bacteroidales bacterium]
MMKHLLKLSLITALMMAVSCKPSPQKAENYYDDIISPLEKVFDLEEEFIVLFNSQMDKTVNDSSTIITKIDTGSLAADFKKMDMAFNNFQIQVSVSKNTLEAMPDFDKNDKLKKTAIDVLDEYSKVCSNEYPELLKIAKIPDGNYSVEDDDKILELTEIIDNKLQEKIGVLTKELKLFAKNYNFEIQNDSLKKNEPK